VTRGTGVGGLAVLKRQHKGDPARPGGMTQLTRVSGDRMRSGFVCGIGTAVTAGASVRGLVVGEWHDQRHPYIRDMTGFTQFCGLRVRR
jgi:hypothetical protein